MVTSTYFLLQHFCALQVDPASIHIFHNIKRIQSLLDVPNVQAIDLSSHWILPHQRIQGSTKR